MPKKNLHRQVKGMLEDKSDALNPISGDLGITISGQKTVEVSNREGYVWVRLRGSQSELIQAYNASVSPIFDLPVLVIRQGNRYAIYGRDIQRYDDWGVTPYLPKHGTQHSFNPELGMGGDVTWVYSRQFVPMLAMPSGTSGAGQVIINSFVYRNPGDGSWEYIGDTASDNTLPAKPTNNQARMMLLYWDLSANDSAMLTGTPFDASITGTSAVLQYIPTTTDQSRIPLAGIRLVSGTSVIGWDNIYDVRQFAVNTPAPFSGGGVSIWDEGVPQGTGTTLNFLGAGVTASISGSVASITVSNSPPVTGSVVIQDEGIVKGSALTLNFVGSNIDASISGTIARIFVTGSVGGGGGVVAADMWTSGSTGAGIRPSETAGSDATGQNSLAHGVGTMAVGQASHAEGSGTLASGTASHAEGAGSQAYGDYSYAGGSGNKAVGQSSHVSGVNNIVSGSSSMASGASHILNGSNSAIIAGASNRLYGERSSILSGLGITGSVNDTAYTDYFNIRHLSSGTFVSNLGIASDGGVITGTSVVAETNSENIFRCDSPSGTSSFVGTINGAPSGNTLIYTPVSGTEGAMVPQSANQLAKMRLYNTTLGGGAYLLITACNLNTNQLTFSENVPGSWLNGHTITIASQTVSGGGFSWVDLEMTSGPLYKNALWVRYQINSATVGNAMRTHPFETFGAGKLFGADALAASQTTNVGADLLKITNNVFSLTWTGAPATVIIREAGYT